MVNLVILFIVMVAIIIIPVNVNSEPIQELEVAGFLDMLENPQKHEIKQRWEGESRGTSTGSSSADDSDSDSDDEDNRALKNTDVRKLIQRASRDRDNNNKYTYRNRKDRELEINGIPVYSKPQHTVVGRDFFTNSIFEQLLHGTSEVNNQNPQQKITKKRLVPNDLLSSSLLEAYDGHEKIPDLNNYSKIYIVLNPLAIQKSKSEGALNNLISKILSMASSKNKARQEKSKAHRYEGLDSFVNNGYLSRRTRLDSNEVYNLKDSVVEEYKPKRSRSDYGGGGAGGRTAIPYIRHRGDIYERDD